RTPDTMPQDRHVDAISRTPACAPTLPFGTTLRLEPARIRMTPSDYYVCPPVARSPQAKFKPGRSCDSHSQLNCANWRNMGLLIESTSQDIFAQGSSPHIGC